MARIKDGIEGYWMNGWKIEEKRWIEWTSKRRNYSTNELFIPGVFGLTYYCEINSTKLLILVSK